MVIWWDVTRIVYDIKIVGHAKRYVCSLPPHNARIALFASDQGRSLSKSERENAYLRAYVTVVERFTEIAHICRCCSLTNDDSS